MKTETIAISLDRVLECVYASAALGFHTASPKAERPDVLGHDQAPALKCVARRTAAEFIFSLGRGVCATNLVDEPDADIITIDLAVPPTLCTDALCTLAESALAASTLAVAYSGSDARTSDTYTRFYTATLGRLKSLLLDPGLPGFIEAA